jgi:hypothetical protein
MTSNGAENWPFPEKDKTVQPASSESVNGQPSGGEWPFPLNDRKEPEGDSANASAASSKSPSRLKHLGICPFCSASMQPSVLEENTMRRDICQCSECSEKILVCRTPGCQDYAKGGSVYDDELCPSCTSSTVSVVGTIAVGVVSIIGAALAESIIKGKSDD